MLQKTWLGPIPVVGRNYSLEKEEEREGEANGGSCFLPFFPPSHLWAAPLHRSARSYPQSPHMAQGRRPCLSLSFFSVPHKQSNQTNLFHVQYAGYNLPPVVPSSIPFVGNGLSFAQGPVQYTTQAYKQVPPPLSFSSLIALAALLLCPALCSISPTKC